MGLLITYSSVLSTTFNSALATSVTGNSKDLFMTALGWLLFGGMPITAQSVIGITGSFIGSFAYSYVGLVKQRQVERQKTATATATVNSTVPHRELPPISTLNISVDVVPASKITIIEDELIDNSAQGGAIPGRILRKLVQ